MTQAVEGSLRWYVESDQVADCYKNQFETVIEAFNSGMAVKIESGSVAEGSSRAAYLIETGDRSYRYGTVIGGEYDVTEFESITESHNLRLLLMMGASITPVDVGETPLSS